MPNELPRQYEVFFKKAVADVEIAALAISAGAKNIDDATIMFHLQQAAEKLLKALLAFHGVHFEKIHDLLQLIDQCADDGIELPEYTSQFSILNPFAVMGRYDILAPGEIDLAKWLNILHEFKKFVHRAIEADPKQGGENGGKNGKKKRTRRGA